MSFLGQLYQAKAELTDRTADPFRQGIEAVVRGKQAISTTALLDLLDLPTITSNARRVGKTMRALNFVSIKSCRLVPGGLRNTVARGWARRNHEPSTGAADANQQGAVT